MYSKEKEIAAVGISVATGCKPCTEFHVKAARKAGALEEEIVRAIDVALSVRVDTTEVIKEYASTLLVETQDVNSAAIQASKGTRLDKIVLIGAAFGVNCVSTLGEQLNSASQAGISSEEITMIARLAMYIKKRASSHVERLCGVKEVADSN